jgi:hypothetical protein
MKAKEETMSKRCLNILLVSGAALMSGVALAHHEAFKASQVLGETLHNARGEAIGEVQDFVIENDEVLSAVISVGGTLGVGDRLVAVPARELQYSHEKSEWHIEMTKAQVEALPRFEPEGILDVESAHR